MKSGSIGLNSTLPIGGPPRKVSSACPRTIPRAPDDGEGEALDADAVWPDPRAHAHPRRVTTIEAPWSKEARMSQDNGHGQDERPTKGVGRRRFLKGAAAAAAVTSVPTVWIHRAGAAGKVVVRTIGGAYEEACVKAIFEPFQKATGIEVVKVPATLGKLLAMFEAGSIEIDVVDAGELGVLSISQKGGLDKINYKGWKLTNPEDIDPVFRREA